MDQSQKNAKQVNGNISRDPNTQHKDHPSQPAPSPRSKAKIKNKEVDNKDMKEYNSTSLGKKGNK